MTKTTAPAIVSPTVESIDPDTVVTMSKTDYYVVDNYRGKLELIRLHDMKDGFSANVVTHRVKAGRPATEAETKAVQDFRYAKLMEAAAFRVGSIVKTKKPSKHADPNALYVIIKESAKTVSIIELGGNAQGSYLTAPRTLLTIVNPADVLK